MWHMWSNGSEQTCDVFLPVPLPKRPAALAQTSDAAQSEPVAVDAQAATEASTATLSKGA